MKTTSLALILSALFLGGCSTTQQGELTLCKEPRPQICTREYRPVCGELTSGGQHTFSNGCEACAAEGVAGYRMGKCEQM